MTPLKRRGFYLFKRLHILKKVVRYSYLGDYLYWTAPADDATIGTGTFA
jgi:hypothetical protein